MIDAISNSFQKFMAIKYFTLVTLLLTACLITSCTDNDPVTEPDTYVYLVQLNDEPDLQSLTIVDSMNGRGSMIVPDIQAHLSSDHVLVIDRVDENRANIASSQPGAPNISNVVGAGFFTLDSVYLELTIDGFTNRDILSGSR